MKVKTMLWKRIAMIRGTTFAGCALFLLLGAGCGERPDSSTAKPVSDRKIRVTTTVTMVGDLVKQVGGDRVEVQGLMGPGVDPHLYKATASDVTKLQNADVIFYSGLLLEGKMQDIFSKLARAKKYVYAVTEAIPPDSLLEPPEFAGHYDPHVWFEVPSWKLCVETVVKGLSEYDPASKAYYEQRGVEVKLKMDQLHDWALKRAAELPQEKRILITSHDAFNYFGRAYGFKVVGLQGISTVTESSLADMAKMVEFIKKNNVKAVFVESSVAPTTIKRISEDAGVKIGGELFSDAMGTPGQIENGYDLGTYEGMIKHNLDTVVNALK
ncbi:MAG TPA: zinc ABC transporter substrate-binding protein [Methylomirabilota bacterium]|nr:zinc ABC transporter substrate-binding protein [Methylomirabilota bacterium]